MAKVVKEERLALVVELTREEGTGPVEVKCRADYVVEAEGLTETRPLDVPLTPAQETTVKQFGAQVLQMVKDAEGIGA